MNKVWNDMKGVNVINDSIFIFGWTISLLVSHQLDKPLQFLREPQLGKSWPMIKLFCAVVLSYKAKYSNYIKTESEKSALKSFDWILVDLIFTLNLLYDLSCGRRLNYAQIQSMRPYFCHNSILTKYVVTI